MASSPAADSSDLPKRKNASTVGAATAVSRSVLTYFGQMFAFYIRHPVKLFRPASVDYTFAAKAINPAIKAGTAPIYKTLTPFVIAESIKNHGWSFVGNNVVPPFLANMTIGVVLYTTYMAAMPWCTGGHESENVYPPPKFRGVFAAGAMAGAAQTLVSTPLLTLQAHFTSPSPMQSLWKYAYSTVRQLGFQATYSPLRSTLIKEFLSYGLFFGVFEYVKQQGYYHFLDLYYGGHRPVSSTGLIGVNERKPHWSIAPGFVLLAGTSASVAFSTVAYPMQNIQAARFRVPITYRDFLASPSTMRVYVPSLWEIIKRGGLYRGFIRHSLRMIPGSSVALIIFEAVRRKFAPEGEGVWGGQVVVPMYRD